MSRGTVLLIEDNIKLNDGNRRALEGAGYTVLSALTLEKAREFLRENETDIILLDVGMPDGDGFGFCEEIRAETNAHILFLTARREHLEILRGLGAGGDDYITKPFRLEELLARVDAAARRRDMGSGRAWPVKTGNLTIDVTVGQAFVNGVNPGLSPTEFSLLLFFARNEDKVLEPEEIYQNVWDGTTMAGDKRAAQRRVQKLRNILADKGCSHNISTVYGKGYCFELVNSDNLR